MHAVVCDVSKPEQVSVFAEERLSRYGAVHVLCNNAGVGTEVRPRWNASVHDWHWVLGVDLMGVIHGVRSFVPRSFFLAGLQNDVHTTSRPEADLHDALLEVQ